MKRTITLVLWAVCILALLAGCSNQENEIGNINDYTPIALLDDAVVEYSPKKLAAAGINSENTT